MGWKAVKEFLNIKEPYIHVHMVEGNLCIGSGYIATLMTFSPEGALIKSIDSSASQTIIEIKNKLTEEPQTLVSLLACEDRFDVFMTVYTYEGGEIVEKHCERVGYPNVTHDGQLMFDTSHFVDKKDAIARARKSVASGITNFQASLTELERKVAECKEGLERHLAEKAVLDSLYP